MFLLLPMGVDYRAWRYPVVTFTLMGICTVVYLITIVAELFGDTKAVVEWVFIHLWLVPSESHWWTFLTHQFVHEGFFHLAGNMVYLFLFGSCVEDLVGRLQFTIFYLLSGVVAAFSYVLMSPEHFASRIPMGGASGAISACIGGFLLLLAATKIEFKWVIFFFFRVYNGEFMLPAWLVISFWFLKDLGLMILTTMAGNKGGGVAFGAHVGGTVFGMAWMAVAKLGLKNLDDEVEDELAPVMTRRVEVHVRNKPEAAVIQFPKIHLFFSGAQSGPFTRSQIQ